MRQPKRVRLKLRDIIFAEIDGWSVIPLGLLIGLLIIVIPLAVSRWIEIHFPHHDRPNISTKTR
jgi:hypothetical protein